MLQQPGLAASACSVSSPGSELPSFQSFAVSFCCWKF